MNVALESIITSLDTTKAIILGFDDVIYPVKDYNLQVFYMFGQFIEFLEGRPVGMPITEDLKSIYLSSGKLPSFAGLSEKYDLKDSYHEKLDRLYHQVQLPLKLELYPIITELLVELKDKELKFLVLTDGDPFMQLNKMKQMEWNGLDKEIKLYFVDELKFKNLNPIEYLMEDNNLQKKDVIWFEYPDKAFEIAGDHGLSNLNPSRLLNELNK